MSPTKIDDDDDSNNDNNENNDHVGGGHDADKGTDQNGEATTIATKRLDDDDDDGGATTPSMGVVDITRLVEECAASLTYTDPYLCNESSFSLHDSMTATQLMDRKMDCCEIAVTEEDTNTDHSGVAATDDSKNENNTATPSATAENQHNHGPSQDVDANGKVIFPRPAPTGLRDDFTDLPWDTLSVDDAAYIGLEILTRFQSFLSGASVGESVFTCLYAFSGVLHDMRSRLIIPAASEGEQQRVNLDEVQFDNLSIAKETPAPAPSRDDHDMKGTDDKTPPTNHKATTQAQFIVFAFALALVETTEVVRGIILNADIYEEEDFAINTHNLAFYNQRTQVDIDTMQILERAMKIAGSLAGQDTPAVKAILLILGFQFGFLTICTTLARLDSTDIIRTVEQTKSIVETSVRKLEYLQKTGLVTSLSGDQVSDHVRCLIKRSFDPYINRPLVGNAPVRKIRFLSPHDSIQILLATTAEFSVSVCGLLARGTSLGRIYRILDRVARSNLNILSRSLIILNLYFDDKMLGQWPMHQLILDHMRQWTHLPETLLADEHSQAFLNRLAKPVYDTLKLRTLNRNRQRAYIEAVMLHDWSCLQNEAHLVDIHYLRENDLSGETPPYFSQYVLSTLIDLMDIHVAAGMEAGLFRGYHEITAAYWYRNFLLSARLHNIQLMRQTKPPPPTPTPKQDSRNHQQRSNKKRTQKNNNHKVDPQRMIEEREYELELVVLDLKRNLCRGVTRFVAAIEKAGLLTAPTFEFTTLDRIFEKRFEVFAAVRQPPPLSYEDFCKGSDHTLVSQEDLLATAAAWFQASRRQVDSLLHEVADIDPVYCAMQEDEIRDLVKVCVGNSIYLHKLRQLVDATDKSAKVSFDYSTHDQFCTVKLT